MPLKENGELMIVFHCRAVYTSQGNQPMNGLLKFSVLYMYGMEEEEICFMCNMNSTQSWVIISMQLKLSCRALTLPSDSGLWAQICLNIPEQWNMSTFQLFWIRREPFINMLSHWKGRCLDSEQWEVLWKPRQDCVSIERWYLNTE